MPDWIANSVRELFATCVRADCVPADSTNILDVGSLDVNGTMRHLIPAMWAYYGVDLSQGPNVTHVVPDSTPWPFEESMFGCAICSQVYEHVRKPIKLSMEVFRLLKPGSLYYVCAPNTINYHPYPVDCFRYYADGLASVVEDGGFEILSAYHCSPDADGIGNTTVIARKPLN